VHGHRARKTEGKTRQGNCRGGGPQIRRMFHRMTSQGRANTTLLKRTGKWGVAELGEGMRI